MRSPNRSRFESEVVSPAHQSLEEIVMASGLLAPSHIIILIVVALLFFGPKRLPEIGRSLGQGLRGFKESVTGDHDSDHLPQPSVSPRIEPTAEDV